MNRLELRNAVKDRLAIRSDGSGNSLDGLITNTFVNTALDDALKRISIEKNWFWLATTASLTFSTSTGKAPLPADFMRANELVVNGNPAELLPLDTIIDPLSDNATYGWLIYGTEAQITPVPSTVPTATLYYFRFEPTLSSDSASPVTPVPYHYAIVSYAAYLCAARRQDEPRASLYLQEYGSYLRTMANDNRSTIKKRIKFGRRRDYATWV